MKNVTHEKLQAKKSHPVLRRGGFLGEGGGASVVLDPLALYLFEDAFKLIDTEELE